MVYTKFSLLDVTGAGGLYPGCGKCRSGVCIGGELGAGWEGVGNNIWTSASLIQQVASVS